MKFLKADLTDEAQGVKFISLVNSPATLVDFKTYSYSYQNGDYNTLVSKFQQVNNNTLLGPFMIANRPIIRLLGSDFYFIKFYPEVLKKIANKFSKSNINTNIDFMHNNEIIENAYVNQHWIVESKEDKIYKYFTEDEVPIGSWVGSVKVDNQSFMDKEFIEYELNGFSIEILHHVSEDENYTEEDILYILDKTYQTMEQETLKEIENILKK